MKAGGIISFMATILHFSINLSLADRKFLALNISYISLKGLALLQANGDLLPHVRLSKDLLDEKRYDRRVRPSANYNIPIKVTFSMSLYQILAIVSFRALSRLNIFFINLE